MTDIERLKQENEQLQKLNQKLAIYLRAAIEQYGNGNSLTLKTHGDQLVGLPVNFNFNFTQNEKGDWVVELVDTDK